MGVGKTPDVSLSDSDSSFVSCAGSDSDTEVPSAPPMPNHFPDRVEKSSHERRAIPPPPPPVKTSNRVRGNVADLVALREKDSREEGEFRDAVLAVPGITSDITVGNGADKTSDVTNDGAVQGALQEFIGASIGSGDTDDLMEEVLKTPEGEKEPLENFGRSLRATMGFPDKKTTTTITDQGSSSISAHAANRNAEQTGKCGFLEWITCGMFKTRKTRKTKGERPPTRFMNYHFK